MNNTEARQLAVIIPCLNEELTISKVIEDFRRELPNAEIHVFDNNSSDKTVELAQRSSALVSFEKRQGKGNVVKTMFQSVDADIYVMVDGDGTYPARVVHDLLKPVLAGEADMVVGSRLLSKESDFKRVNRFGNRLFLLCVNLIFGSKLTDIFSGYRVMTRDFVHSLPLFSQGFQIETELTIQALNNQMRIVEIPATLRNRPEGSESKIRILSDGLKILGTIFDLFRVYKPLTFFGGAGLLIIGTGIILGGSVIREFIETGLVPRIPTAILATGLVLSGLLSISVGLVLNTLGRKFKEIHYQLTNAERRLRERLKADRDALNGRTGGRLQGDRLAGWKSEIGRELHNT